MPLDRPAAGPTGTWMYRVSPSRGRFAVHHWTLAMYPASFTSIFTALGILQHFLQYWTRTIYIVCVFLGRSPTAQCIAFGKQKGGNDYKYETTFFDFQIRPDQVRTGTHLIPLMWYTRAFVKFELHTASRC